MTKRLLVIILQLASAGADAYYTDHDRVTRGRERNPIVRPFVQTRAGTVAYFSTTTALHLAIPPILRKHHHSKLAIAAELEGIADNSEAAIYCAAHQRKP